MFCINRRKFTPFILALSAIMCIALAGILLVTLPASAEEKMEEKIKRQIKEDFKDLEKINFPNGIDTFTGEKYQSCQAMNKKGESIAQVSFDVKTGEVNALYYKKDRIPGEPKITKSDAKIKANDYLEKTGRNFKDDYVLVKEDCFSDWTDGLNRKFYQYQFEWKKRIEDALTFDTVYMTVDAGNGEILSWHKVDSDCPPPESKEDLKEFISRAEAIDKVKTEIISPEAWLDSVKEFTSPYLLSTRFEIEEDATKYYELIAGEPHLTWRVDIEYKRLAEVAPNDEHVTGDDLNLTKRFVYVLDAKSGAILDVIQFRDI